MAELERSTLTVYDTREIWRCPQLGGPVTFEYCRRMNVALPCPKLFACWSRTINVSEYLQKNFTEEEIHRVFDQPAPTRLETMFSVLAEVEKRKNAK